MPYSVPCQVFFILPWLTVLPLPLSFSCNLCRIKKESCKTQYRTPSCISPPRHLATPPPSFPSGRHLVSRLRIVLQLVTIVMLFVFFSPIARSVLSIFNQYPHGVQGASPDQAPSYYLEDDLGMAIGSSRHKVSVIRPAVTLR